MTLRRLLLFFIICKLPRILRKDNGKGILLPSPCIEIQTYFSAHGLQPKVRYSRLIGYLMHSRGRSSRSLPFQSAKVNVADKPEIRIQPISIIQPAHFKNKLERKVS